MAKHPDKKTNAHCPSCKRAILPRGQNPLFPFCSARCRAVDLGKWLGEEYRVEGNHPDAEDDGLNVPSEDDET